jgi:hypothetical protein
MNELPQSRREMGQRLARVLDAEAARVRRAFDPERNNDRERKEYTVKGRTDAGRVLWDVFELRPTGAPVLVMGGFAWQEEAIIYARDLLVGRVAVSFPGVRAMFRAPGGAGLAVPAGDMSMPFAKGERVYTRPAEGGGVVVSKQPPKPSVG